MGGGRHEMADRGSNVLEVGRELVEEETRTWRFEWMDHRCVMEQEETRHDITDPRTAPGGFGVAFAG